MRGILKSVGIVALSIYFTQQLIPSIFFSTFDSFIIITGLIFLANFILEPLAKILFFLPSNFLVFNLFKILGNFLVLYFAASSFEEFEINTFEFAGFSEFGISIQAVNFTAIQVTIIAGFIISLISGFIKWLAD